MAMRRGGNEGKIKGPKHVTTVGAMMKKFDRLPTVAQEALRYAAFDWGVTDLTRVIKAGHRPEDIASMVREADANLVSARYREMGLQPCPTT